MADKVLTDAELETRAAERMTELGFDPLADEIIPEGKPIPDEDLEDIAEDGDDDVGEEGDDTGSDTDEDDDSTPEEDDPDDDDTEGEEGATEEDAQKKVKKKDETPELSDAYYRAALHSGMSEDDVVDFMAANSELAIKTFAKMHEQMNRATNEFAEIGRYKKAQRDKPADENKQEPSFKKIDLTKLRDEHPDDEALIDIMEQLQKQNEGLATQVTDLNKVPARSADSVSYDRDKLEEEKIAHTAKQIEDFFGDPSLKSYEQHYGVVPAGSKDWSMLLPSERMNRVAVIEQVEQLVEGAKAIGNDMSVPDALSRAHLVTMQPVQAKMIREDIMKKVLAKSKGITLKPTGKKKASASSGAKKPVTDKDVENNAEARMKKIGLMR